jgi:nicotinamidase-related amidase
MAPNALILIDIQVGFDDPIWGARNNPNAEKIAGALLANWRQKGQSVVHIQHLSIEPGSSLSGAGTAFKPEVTPIESEAIFQKSVNSAFIGTDLEAHLRGLGIGSVTICGLTTPHCVSTTSRMAANLGFQVTLVEDACAAFTSNANTGFDDGPALSAQDIHRTALAHLHGEFAEVLRGEALL